MATIKCRDNANQNNCDILQFLERDIANVSKNIQNKLMRYHTLFINHRKLYHTHTHTHTHTTYAYSVCISISVLTFVDGKSTEIKICLEALRASNLSQKLLKSFVSIVE